MEIHVVEPGETVYSIARDFNVSPQSIISNNGLTNPDDLVPGQALIILIPQTTYVVQEGDTLLSIARQFETTPFDLMRNNPFLEGRYTVLPGQELAIFYNFDYPRRDTLTMGYVYPNIDNNVLRMTLPYLTYVVMFTYGFTEAGDLLPVNDMPVIDTAEDYLTVAQMNVSAMRADGTFSNELIHAMLNDPAAQENLINEIEDTVQRKGYRAVDINFEFVLPEDREKYIQFVEKLTTRLNQSGHPVAVSVAPKTSGDQPGLLYEAQDYEALGRASNATFLMTYEWGYKYGPPMAVAPINRVREVLDYAVSVIPPEKIFIGIPNYGYDWPLPFVEGETEARTISNNEAIELAARENTDILFDEEAMTPYFYYTDDDEIEHVVWFEDARSIAAKAALIREYGLRGATIWTVMRYFQPLWTVINALYNPVRIA